jgi:predicted transcriptional regulator
MWQVIRKRSKHIHEPNEVRVLRLIRDRGTISRIEIAKTTGLHKATVTDLVSKLIDAGFLEDTGEGNPPQGGQKEKTSAVPSRSRRSPAYIA